MLIQGTDRGQLQMFCLEESIAPDAFVRIIDLLVDALNLEELGFISKGNINNGRAAFSTSVLLKLYYYGYANRVRSSRRLEREARTNLEAIWLMRGLQPCYKTIADFRKDNKVAFVAAFKRLNALLRSKDLFGKETIAVDGTKIRAQNAMKNNFSPKKVERHLNYIDQKIKQYLEQLEAADEGQEKNDIQNKIDTQNQRKEKYQNIEQQLEAARDNHQNQISTTDPDARALPKKMNIVEVSYNVQSAVDQKHKLVAHFDITNENDTYALHPTAKAAMEDMGAENITVLADKGYDTGSQLKDCHHDQIKTIVSPRQKNTSKKKNGFRKEDFGYDKISDSYTCPAGETMTSNGREYVKNRGKHRKEYKVKVYKLPFETCKACPFKEDCAGAANLKNSKGRSIERSEYDDYIEANRQRFEDNKDIYKQRQTIVEHPFGTIKRQWGFDHTLLKTIPKVKGEFAIVFTIYNLRRSLSILGFKGLKSLLKAAILHFLVVFTHLKPHSPTQDRTLITATTYQQDIYRYFKAFYYF